MVELVSVIVLVGILSLVAVSRFSGRDGFAEYAVRDQLISSYRLAQQRAMYDHSGRCYRLLIDGTGFGAESDVSGSFSSVGSMGRIELTGDYSDISVTPRVIYFDGLGNALVDSVSQCTGANLGSSIDITIASAATLITRVYPTGYVQAR